MARNNKINMPSSTAGITRYFDDYKSNIELQPGHVIILCILAMIIVGILFAFGNSWFGI
jgi:preprotein translocase subunit Sec61beta